MHPTGQPEFEFALDLLHWSLTQPLVYGERAWAGRVSRALDRVRDAFDRHAGLVRAPDGPLAQVADPRLLPLTDEAQAVQRLARDYLALRDRIELVAAQFRGALLLFPAPAAAAPAPEPLPEVRAYRLFDTLGSCVADLLAALDAHLAAEKTVLGPGPGASPPGAVSRSRLSRGPRRDAGERPVKAQWGRARGAPAGQSCTSGRCSGPGVVMAPGTAKRGACTVRMRGRRCHEKCCAGNDQPLAGRPDKEETATRLESIFTRSSSRSPDRCVSIPLARAVESRSRRRSEEEG
jgi:hypothetical protein